MQAILLAGGFGTRLHPLTLNTPKQMLPLGHRPMIEHVVAGLARHGVDRVVLALGYRDDAFRAAYPGGRCAGVELRCATEPEPLDTAGAIRFAYEAQGMGSAAGGTFLVANGDVLTDLDVSAMVRRHHALGAEATIHLVPVEHPAGYGAVVAGADGLVSEFVEKPQSGEPAPSRWINAGTYVMDASVIDRIPPGRRSSVEREVFPAMAAERRLWAHREDAYWLDAGTPQAYLQAQLDMLDGRRGPAVQGVSPQASVDPGAVVERSVVMAGADVAAGAVVRASALHSGAAVGAGAAVQRSVVGEGASVAAGASVSDSLIGAGRRVAPSAVLCDARVQ